MVFLNHSYFYFTHKFKNKKVVFKILHKRTALHIFIDEQESREKIIYSEFLRKYIEEENLRRGKKLHLICILSTDSIFREVRSVIGHFLRGESNIFLI